MNNPKNPPSGKGEGRASLTLCVYVLGALTAVALAVMAILLCLPAEPTQGEFVPPDFDSAATVGVPTVPEELRYWSPGGDGLAYRFSLCDALPIRDGAVAVYLTNHEENTVYLKLRILDGEGHILGETGLLRPGEYVRDVRLTRNVTEPAPVTIKIMGYEPETYLSAGAVTVRTVLGG